MIRAFTTVACGVAALSLLGPVRSQDAPTQVKTVQDLVTKLREREKAVESVVLEIATSGSMPDGARVETRGTLRVLKRTHFHSSMKVTFGNDMTAETETVKTPEGLAMREKDPSQGEIFLRMDRALLDRLNSATEALGRGAFMSPGADMANGPLGSIMLEDLDQQFQLEVSGPKMIDGQECWTVDGARRSDLAESTPFFGLADRVGLVVRRADCAVLRMTQFAEDRVIGEVRIEKLQLDLPLDEASFKIETPDSARVLNVMDHPPAKAQIERVFAEAEASGWKRDGEEEAPKTPDAGGEKQAGEGAGETGR